LFSAAGLKQPFKYTLRVPVSVSLAQEITSGFVFQHSLYLEDMGSSLDLLRWLFLSKRAWSPAQKSEYRYLLKKGLSSLVLGKSNLG
jgi:hypothetical protein